MQVRGKVAVVTGAASGIGRATALRFAAEGAAGVVVADLNAAGLEPVAKATGGLAVQCDVSRESEIQNLVAKARERYGRIDIYFSNAGVGNGGGLETPDEVWEKHWKIHVMAHVWAARAVVDQMIAQPDGGYFLTTASAAGLLNIVETVPYGVTKHGTVAFSEWLRIAYGRRGLRVSCLCPQAVMTGMYTGQGSAGVDGALQPDQVAQCIVDVMNDETFLVLPHPVVLDYLRGKTANYDKWLGGMQKVYSKYHAGN